MKPIWEYQIFLADKTKLLALKSDNHTISARSHSLMEAGKFIRTFKNIYEVAKEKGFDINSVWVERETGNKICVTIISNLDAADGIETSIADMNNRRVTNMDITVDEWYKPW